MFLRLGAFASRWRWLLVATVVAVAVVWAETLETSACVSAPGSAEGVLCTVGPALNEWMRLLLAVAGLAITGWLLHRQVRRES